MHLLNATAAPRDDAVAIDLQQDPGDIVVLSAADSDLACLAAARRTLGDDFPTVRLAQLLRLGHPMSVDLYDDTVLRHAKLVIARVHGGISYWPYGVERLAERARAGGPHLALLPGDARPDPDLFAASSLPAEALTRLWRYTIEGGVANAASFLRYAASLIGHAAPWTEPEPVPRVGIWGDAEPVPGAVPIVFYRAVVQAGNTEPIDALAGALRACGLPVLPVFVASLKEAEVQRVVGDLIARCRPPVILNTTGFALSGDDVLSRADCPVLQVVLSGGDRDDWATGTRGLAPRDIAMNVALPEVDGRIFSRAISFKRQDARDPLTQADVARHVPEPSRVGFVADLAHNWARLRTTPPADRRVGLILANYPNRDGRIGNGVGLDTPASAVRVLDALAGAGYGVTDAPRDGAALIRDLLSSRPPSPPRGEGRGEGAAPHDGRASHDTTPSPCPLPGGEREKILWKVKEYEAFFATLPPSVRDAVTARWGDPARDPSVADGAFVLPGFVAGQIAVLIQPTRGYDVDPTASY
ncbi:MAG: cobaltochelatase subunit CobN, partial [Alphaproteobacteria bacterium]|nr:cobaltochelatase subunit CobN [Alphaproteobacteria bacterium]